MVKESNKPNLEKSKGNEEKEEEEKKVHKSLEKDLRSELIEILHEGNELRNKRQELENKLIIKKQEVSDLEKQLMEYLNPIDSTDETTANDIKKIAKKLFKTEKEMEDIEREIENINGEIEARRTEGLW